jgi:peptidoglycan/xylan/chitin deacetylase (PgdA/CDA1 family)
MDRIAEKIAKTLLAGIISFHINASAIHSDELSHLDNNPDKKIEYVTESVSPDIIEKGRRDKNLNDLIKANDIIKRDELIKTIPIIMYHEIGNPLESEYGTRFTVTPKMLRSHLELLHKNGFVPVSLDEYLSDDFSKVPIGKKPIILTFDDSTGGQFRYIRHKDGSTDESYAIDPYSAVGIIDEFAKEHKDFFQKAIFFIDFVDKNGYFEVPFSQPGLESKKIEYLLKSGYDVECHTVFHPFLNKEPKKTLVNNILLYDYIMNNIKNNLNIPMQRKYKTLAFPYGDVPSGNEKNSFLSKNFDFCFGAYANQYGSRAYRINSAKFVRNNIPRIEMNNDFVNLKKYVTSGS